MAKEENKTLLKVNELYPAPERVKSIAHISEAEYDKLYQESIAEPENFWARIAEEELTWFKKWDQVLKWEHPY